MAENKIIDYPGNLYNFAFDIIHNSGYISKLTWSLLGFAFVLILCYLTYRHYKNSLTENKKLIKYSSFDSTFFFLAVVSLGIILLRFPTFGVTELNVDESEWIAGAATLIKDPRFWYSVNGTTSGPLNIFPLCLINLLGFSLNY